MSAAPRLQFTLEEHGEDALADKVCEILQRVLQPDSDLPLNDAVQNILESLPARRPYSTEAGTFLWTCYEVSQQIPYDHPSMTKLVTLIYVCLNSPHLNEGLQENPSDRYTKLAETLQDCWNSSEPSEGPSKFVNFQTFDALVYSRGMLREPSHYIIHILDKAFGGEKSLFGRDKPADCPAAERDAWIQAASQWILHQGDELYAQIAQGHLKLKKWEHWHESFEAVASGKTGKTASAYSKETIRLADQAAVAMAALEKNKAG